HLLFSHVRSTDQQIAYALCEFLVVGHECDRTAGGSLVCATVPAPPSSPSQPSDRTKGSPSGRSHRRSVPRCASSTGAAIPQPQPWPSPSSPANTRPEPEGLELWRSGRIASVAALLGRLEGVRPDVKRGAGGTARARSHWCG